MRKIQQISELVPSIPFSEYDFYKQYQDHFPTTELGRLYQLFPFKSIAAKLKLCQSRLGRSNYFSPEGKVALMVLKHYSGLSDRQLIDQLNGNAYYQIFCGVRIHPSHPLTNFKIVSDIRCEIGLSMDINLLQQELAAFWKPLLNNTGICFTDATCYESYIRYPSDIKLLWESVSWIYKQLRFVVKSLRIRMPRSKYDKIRNRYLSYSKKRKRKVSATRVLTRSLLHLLNKLVVELDDIVAKNRQQIGFSRLYYKRLSTIKKVLKQQQVKFSGGKIKGAIVSIDKEYIRPIIRGKEKKAVEFGAKVNSIQVDGINFIEHLSFEAFNEGIRLQQCIHLQQQLFRKRVTHVGADAIYATNANRKYCTGKQIATSFVRKGRAGRYEAQAKQMRSILGKERSSRLEGSFGTEKEYYSLGKVKARSKATEIVWIFFSIHTANLRRLSERIQKQKQRAIA